MRGDGKYPLADLAETADATDSPLADFTVPVFTDKSCTQLSVHSDYLFLRETSSFLFQILPGAEGRGGST